ncbi:acyltransferase [Dokdonia pacifica]|uniref:Peptidoglycan/LPS O-acetylase OafA/YrhL, contains acyltransferase and SGNH-hydrolase domains n=1 Tax=Dokdonia pacifica TaxID=1627892 RepID=A0A239BR73_9FLAO|nr:acyltransferase [Dokdonia pacifica]GGG28063.1 acyltransferase [Dokdonia pacifica]SNS10152.1 Peptidoglycan/LPS O-acetylase OafA/YrhL, contains acyltransferase and SGNH-hydrolase domains [Dokdonia pacifica]
MQYIKQLDSIRAVAVLLVIVSHWLPKQNILNSIPNGQIGVDIFFVLSGFLISKILFDNRDKAIALGQPVSNVLKGFYIRRSLRIFPIYYLTIIVVYIAADSTNTSIKDALVYYLTYTSNFYFFNRQAWDGILSHMWSLAVEEQYYLIWPWLVLLVRKKYILPIIFIFIAIGIGSQLWLHGVKMSRILTFTCFDAFGIGSLLAWGITYKKEKMIFYYNRLRIIAVIAFLYFIWGVTTKQWMVVSIRTTVSMITVWLICYIYLYHQTEKLRGKLILNNPMLIFLGKISYGIYLYHNIVPKLVVKKYIDVYVNPLLPDFFNVKYKTLLLLAENGMSVVLISWLSFMLIEKRFLMLKKRFNYITKKDH